MLCTRTPKIYGRGRGVPWTCIASSFVGVIDVTDTQTDETFIDIEIEREREIHHPFVQSASDSTLSKPIKWACHVACYAPGRGCSSLLFNIIE